MAHCVNKPISTQSAYEKPLLFLPLSICKITIPFLVYTSGHKYLELHKDKLVPNKDSFF